ncbi:MAG: squalene/phytoene synthase family protein [Pseudomonadota bacterium]
MSDEKQLSPCAALVRKADPDRFLATLIAPARRRASLFALYAFNHEVAKTRDVVSEPMLGQIRLQWWRDALEEAAAGEPRKHEVVEGLAAALADDLARAPLDALIDARERDLDDAPFADLRDLNAYIAGVAEPLVDAAAPLFAFTDADLAAARAAGRAWAMSGLLRAARARSAAKRPVFPIAVLRQAQAPAADIAELRDTPGTRAAAFALAAAAHADIAVAKGGDGRPLTVYARLAKAYLRRLKRRDHAVFTPGWGEPRGLDRVIALAM